ncbi:MAG: competence/damage-inducible protein A [Halanaeroarchaeum sp.]
MDVAILTVGDEVLAGDTTNTNANWIADRVTSRGAGVSRILTIPDDASIIRSAIEDWRGSHDAIVVTGGLGGTHDDVTVAGVAAAYDRPTVVQRRVREHVLETLAAYRDEHPETVSANDFDLDVDAWAALPEGSRAVLNPVGLSPGFVLDDVYAFPGVPEEMRATFDVVAEEFDGETVSQDLYTPLPEAALIDPIASVRDRFDVSIGSYPATTAANRVTVTGDDENTVSAALEYLEATVDTVDPS